MAGVVGYTLLIFAALLEGTSPIGAALAFGTAGAIMAHLLFALRETRRECTRLRKLEAIVESTDLIIITTDKQGVINGFNPSAERALGVSADHAIGNLTADQFHPPELIEHPAGSGAPVYCNFDGGARQEEWLYVRRDGTTFPAIVTVSSIYDESGEVIGHFGIGMDISQSKEHDAALREKQELIASIATTSPTIFYTFDLSERRVLYSNRPLAGTLGYSDEQITTMGDDPLPCVIHPEDLDILYNRFQKCAELDDNEVLETEFRCLAANGELRWLFSRDVVFKRDAFGRPCQILVNVVDITERKLLDEQIESQVLEIQDSNLALEIQTNALEEANAQLEALAFTDGLTGIANHRSFQEQLGKRFEAARRRKRKLSLMLIDVDRFKQYNDAYGHPSGDIVLKRVAQVLKDGAPEDFVVARYGGEEFAVLCPNFGPEEALLLAEGLRKAVEQTPWPERMVTVSIGTASLNADVTSPSELVGAADSALYTSKARGRNCITMFDFDVQKRLAG